MKKSKPTNELNGCCMLTQVRTPRDIFFMPQRLLVPLFQRPYVWSLEAQWEPLWEDIRRLAERRMAGDMHATHFLGAVVVQQQATSVGALTIRTIIDGQQRLTTLQLFLNAIQGILVLRGYDALSRQLTDLVENADHFRQDPEDRFKVWPTNRDRPAFTQVMSEAPPVEHATLPEPASRLVKAHQYFTEIVSDWLSEVEEADASLRAAHLVSCVTSQLELVAIELQADEDAQEIFETLNARGTPLTPADLIKNFVFQRLDASPEATEAAYLSYWAEFETPFWEKEVSSGRVKYSRSSLFLNQWLIAVTLKDVPARQVFAQFKRYVVDSEIGMQELLPAIKESADAYRAMLEGAENKTSVLSRLEKFVYRTGNLESEIVKPLLIWLSSPAQRDVPQVQLEKALASIESWLVRRALLRAKSAGTNLFLVTLLAHLSRQGHDRIGDATEEFLAKQTGPVSYWPGDAEVRRELSSLPIYWRLRRGRLRMLLEAVEDHLRGFDDPRPKHEQPVIRATCTIEHILPQEWRSHWSESVAPGQELERDRLVQTLGNLTLVTQSLNSKVSNGAWATKREGLRKHTSLMLTREVVEQAPENWTDDSISDRTAELINRILATWPVPAGHTGVTEAGIERATQRVEVADLVRAGVLAAGTTLYSRVRAHFGKPSEISEDGRIFVDGTPYGTLSAAAKAVTGSASEAGWWFWLLDTGSNRSMADVRREYMEGFEYADDIADEDGD